MRGYTTETRYVFTAAGEEFAVIGRGPYQLDGRHGQYLEIEEVRKNGQEDCHFGGLIVCLDGTWRLEDEARDHLDEYFNGGTADAIEAYVQKCGSPFEVE